LTADPYCLSDHYQFNKIVVGRGHDGVIIPIENTDNQDASFLIDTIQNSDFIGFANPIYGGNIPPIMRNFINKITNITIDKKNGLKPIYIIHLDM
jgi:NAD(P)H-dependent FMN reductase